MVKLGKLVKGRTVSTTEQKNTMIKIRHQDKKGDDINKEQELMKHKREQLKNSQLEEQKTAHFNRMKILTHWRKIMRVAKTETLKKEIQVYQQNHDREVDAKDAILQMLDRDLEEAEEQYQMALRNHLIRVDQLISLQNSRLRGLHEEFERDLNILKSEFDKEKREIRNSHEMEKKELEDMIATIEEEETAKLNELKENFESLREETKNENVEDLESMKHDLIKKIEDLDKDFEVNFNRYVSDTEDRSREYSEKLKKNENDAEQIKTDMRKIQRLKEQIGYWSLKIHQNKRECDERNAKLRKEKETISKHYLELKKKMLTFRDEESKRLANLTTNSKNCMDTLKDYQRLGEKILKTSELCRKLETEKEKVLPFYQSDPDTLEEVPEHLIEKIDGVKKGKYNEFQLLDQFYKRYNKVLLDKVAIDKQKATLEKENMFFKSLLKQYLDGVSVNDDVMGANNPLLVVNNKVSLNRPPVERSDGPVQRPVIEGNVVINNNAIQNS